MALGKEQAEQIKKQLFSQVDNSQLENKEQIKKQIQDMNEAQLEEFLKQQQAQQLPQGQQSPTGESPCIFCSIIKGETPSYKIAENKKAIAILELNPVSKGHSIILPLEHVTTEKLPTSALNLAKKIAKKIKTKFKPEDIKIETSSLQGHAMINVIPIYKDGKMEKKQASEDELKKLQAKLETKKRSPREKKVKPIKELQEIHFRIP